VAIRVVYDRKTLPLNLHGLKGPELFGGVYMSCDRLAAWRAGAPDPIRWIVISRCVARVGANVTRKSPRTIWSRPKTRVSS
ncbi:hypothetical protein ACC758_39405, partial [Rhizobium ruizarguesonis]